MKYCNVEGESFPDSQFRRDEDSGQWFHYPPGEHGHAADRFSEPPGPYPVPADELPPEIDEP